MGMRRTELGECPMIGRRSAEILQPLAVCGPAVALDAAIPVRLRVGSAYGICADTMLETIP